MVSPKVKEWEQCELRYVAEGKLNRLSDEDLVELERLLIARLGSNQQSAKPDASAGVARDAVIHRIMVLKSELALKRAADAAAVAEEAKTTTEAEEAKPTEEELDDMKERMAALVQLKAATELQPLPSESGQARPATAATAAAIIAEAEEAKAATTATATATASPPPDADECLVKAHALRFCSFNAMKLKLSHPCKAADESDDDENTVGYKGTDKGEALTRKWMMLAAVMSSYDVIVMQEIPGKQKSCDTRMERFHDMLSLASDESWTWQALHSRPSGKDGKTEGTGAEVHVAFIKSPIELRGFGTLMKVGAVALDYAPLQLHLYDPRFENEADRGFVLTSVHLPPKGRRQARDSQLGALLRNYAAVDTSEYRLNLPFAPNKETKRSPTHVIAGDFNVFPGSVDDDGTEDYGMTAAGFVAKIPQNAATSAGGNHYDNFLVNRASDERLIIGGGILRLKPEATANSRQGEPGLSDHWPITLTVQEYAKVNHATKAEPKKKEEEKEAPVAMKPGFEDLQGSPETMVRTIEGSYTGGVILEGHYHGRSTGGEKFDAEPEPDRWAAPEPESKDEAVDSDDGRTGEAPDVESVPEPEPEPELAPAPEMQCEACEEKSSVEEREAEPAPAPAPEVRREAYEEEPSVEEREALAVIESVAVAEAAALDSVREEEPEEPEDVAAAVSAVVKGAMEQVAESVLKTATAATDPEPNLIDL